MLPWGFQGASWVNRGGGGGGVGPSFDSKIAELQSETCWRRPSGWKPCSNLMESSGLLRSARQRSSLPPVWPLTFCLHPLVDMVNKTKKGLSWKVERSGRNCWNLLERSCVCMDGQRRIFPPSNNSFYVKIGLIIIKNKKCVCCYGTQAHRCVSKEQQGCRVREVKSFLCVKEFSFFSCGIEMQSV